jgi:hypothetical protein
VNQTETPGNHFGSTPAARAWWALAALSIFEQLDEADDAPAIALGVRFANLAAEDDETLYYIITDHVHLIPKEILRHLSIEGEV